MGKHWRIHSHDTTRIAQLEQVAKVSPVMAQLLICRGIDEASAIEPFLSAKLTDLRDPQLLPGLPLAAEKIFAAVAANERIVIYGDYDADGMTAAAILVRCLTLLGADVGYYVPNRLEEGYGLNHEALTTLAQRGARMVISVDCGIASVAEAETARRLGLSLIVTDHHHMGPTLPAADAIVHPGLPGSSYPFLGLCGAGVAFKLAWALCQLHSGAQRVTERLRNFLLTAVGLAAIGAVADVVPLIDENRVLVRHGLKTIRSCPPEGLAALMRITKLDQKPFLSGDDIAFTLAPRLNAAGRLGQAQLGIELLTTDSPSRAEALAEYIHQLNESRGSLERSVYLAAQKQLKENFDPIGDPAIVLAGAGWHAGVIGIVAGRLAEKYHRPVVMIALDELGTRPGVGSARSAGTFNLHAALQHCKEHLIGCGGHAAAAGLQIEAGCIDAFRSAFCEHVAETWCEEERIAELWIDAEAPLSQITRGVVQQIEQLAPFGQSNPQPLLCATRVSLAEPPKKIGNGERHLSLKLSQHGVTIRAVGFGHGESAEQLAALTGPIDICYRPVINSFRGRQSVELHLIDWRESAVAAKPVV